MTIKHVGQRLSIAFAVLIAILIGVGLLGLRRTRVVQANLDNIIGRQLTNLQLARKALMVSNDNSRNAMQIVLVENRELVRSLLVVDEENSRTVTSLLEESERRCESGDEKHLLEEVKRTRKPYLENYKRAIHLLVDERKHDEAEAVMVNDALPALAKHHEAWDAFIEFQQREFDTSVKQAQAENGRAHRISSFLIAFAGLLALAIAIFATREATQEMAARLAAKNEVSNLNATLEERVRQRTAELSDALKRLNLLGVALEAAANGIAITDRRGSILWVNGSFTSMTGYSKEEVLGKNPRLLKSGAQSDSFYKNLWSTISSGEVWKGEVINRRKDGTTYPEEMTITPVLARAGNTSDTHFVAIKQDISARKQAEETLLFKTALLEAQADTTIDGILVVDESDHIIFTNKQFARHLGLPDALLAQNDDRVVLKYFVDQVEDGEAFIAKVRHLYSHRDEKSRDEVRLKNGKVFDRYSAPLVDSKGVYRGRIWYFRDITDRKVAEDRVQFLAYYDALTRLPNRTLLRDRAAIALASARRQGDKLAFVFLDLDGFKTINDSLGHSVGDLLLQAVSERLRTWGRNKDTVARLAGDEFLMILTDQKSIADVAVAAERLINAMREEFIVPGHSLNVGCSIGISIYPEHGADCETLIRNADSAMYRAKEDGRNNFKFFAAEMNDQVVERLTLERGLRTALARKELFLVYQPQMDVASGRMTGLEALLRWHHPELGLVSPDKFIRIAENSGLILPIGEWVLRTACSQARDWQDKGLLPGPIAVNVSAVQFRQGDFCKLVKQILAESGLAPKYLELELTESLLLANAELMLSVVQEIKAMGVSLAIDDFGTGYSSFSYLKRFPVNKFKIDASFIRDVAVNRSDATITTAIISMAKNLNLRVIAEGVEDEAQLAFLRAHRCDEIQGYYFSRPLTADKVTEHLQASLEERVRAQAAGGH